MNSTVALPRELTINHLFLPFLFILMWSSGYVVGVIGLAYTGPYTLIFLRFSVAAIIMLGVSLLTKAV